ncbi:MFS transporter [Galbitalea sp. SE-J8]|uniref:MFS transporter n=1 Tax=Galbitalea sp. SE-J8 TaxID=3054952 RepID=UPI00259D279F|nr:MFS transporter [Galbitalea sp. SE-J8]MDM4761393.1 MFS transporter [Galbitalea sp. SE-J8]
MPSSAPAFPWIGLLTLSGAIFVSVSSEFLPTGLIPEMARDLGASVAVVGQLVTIFAGTVVVATTPLALLTRRFSRKRLVVVVLFVIALANVLAALAPTFQLLAGARVLGGLAHGLFWAVVAAYSAHLVPPQQLGRATAISAGGGSAAFVLGVPVGTAIGQALGWRMAFVVFAAVVVMLAVLVIRFLPAIDHRVPLTTGEIVLPVRRDASLVRIVLLCVVILAVVTGLNTFTTYQAPWLIDVAGFPEDSKALVLFLFGGAGAIGLVVAGLVTDRAPRRAFVVAMSCVIAMIGALALAAQAGSASVVVIAGVLMNVAWGGAPAMLQTRMMRTASFRMRSLAAALQTTAFNVGIGGGAVVGGLVVAGIGLPAIAGVSIGIIALGIVLVVVWDASILARMRRTRRAVAVE